MPGLEPDPAFEATANLSPVSPSPVHTAASQVVPTLQNTVDTIDAMVEAVAGADGAVAVKDFADVAPQSAAGDADGSIEEFVDDDSFSDAYEENGEDPAPAPQSPGGEKDDTDDYARTFDSPGDLDEGGSASEQSSAHTPEAAQAPESANLVTEPVDMEVVPTATKAAEQDEQIAPPTNDIASVPVTQNGMSATVAPSLSASIIQVEPATASNAADSPGEESGQASVTRPAESIVSAPDAHQDSSSSVTGSSESTSGPTNALPSAASLPPRPPVPESAAHTYPSQHHPQGTNTAALGATAAVQLPGYGGSSSSTDNMNTLSSFAQSGGNNQLGVHSLAAASYPSQVPGYTASQGQSNSQEAAWEQFLADERQYMADAKWDRFPEGSRIFIGTRSVSAMSKSGSHIFATGNLSSDKISKREVFDLFHSFGRLAQISLKSAYGFVQYHTVDEGRRAIESMQGMEVKGRRIHLEVSKLQDKSKKDRGKSPERGRDRDSHRRGDSYKQGRDDWRPNRSPRRHEYGHHREDSYGRDRDRDRGYHDSSRGRSRSPSYKRFESYRRRSPSPYGRSRYDNEAVDLPRRYGSDIPDVQIILQPEVNRDFVTWVEGCFKAKGLRTEVMYLHPRISKEQVIQRQAAEGVHAVIDLDVRAQHMSKIPLQAFDRSAGSNNVRFDQYVDLDPSTAAEVVLRAKSSAVPSYSSQPSYSTGGGGYGSRYDSHVNPTPPNAGYGGYQQSPAYPQQQQQAPTAAAPAGLAANLANLVGQVDNNTLQTLLSTIQAGGGGQANAQQLLQNVASAPVPAAAAAAAPQVDINAILGSLGSAQHGQQQQQPAAYGGGPYGVAAHQQQQQQQQQQAPNHQGGGDQAAQVQNIMAQLARFR